jgi:hypothetical protein
MKMPLRQNSICAESMRVPAIARSGTQFGVRSGALLCALLLLPLNDAWPIRAQAQTDPAAAGKQIIQRIDAAVGLRSRAIARYTVQEQYNLYRNGASEPTAQETVQTVYTYAAGKQYTTIAQGGSSLFRSAVIDKLLAEEKDVNIVANREASWITSVNYEMQPQSEVVQLNGRACIVVLLKPRRKSPHLFAGKLWVDAADFTIVRLEGTPSETLSIFAGQSTVARDYAKFNGFAMATHAEGHSHSFLFGDTVLKIDYSGYRIELSPTP